MDHRLSERSDAPLPGHAKPGQPAPAGWRDLREWLALIEANGLLQRIIQPVDPDEELAAITFMATRRDDAPALLFENLVGQNLVGQASGAKVLSNMLGSSKERYALAVGLDRGLSIAEMIAQTRTIMTRRIAPRRIPKPQAPVNEIVLRENEIDLTTLPAQIWPGDGGRYIQHRRHHPDGATRHRPHQCRRLPADAAWTAARGSRSPGSTCARPRRLVGARPAVRGRRRLWRRPGAVHAGRRRSAPRNPSSTWRAGSPAARSN
jgi:hypothetical protein